MAIIKTFTDSSGIAHENAYWVATLAVLDHKEGGKFQYRPYKDKAAYEDGLGFLGGEENYRPYHIPVEVVNLALKVADGQVSAYTKMEIWVRDYAKEGFIKPSYTYVPEGIYSEPDENDETVLLGHYKNENDEVVTPDEALCGYFYGCEIVA